MEFGISEAGADRRKEPRLVCGDARAAEVRERASGEGRNQMEGEFVPYRRPGSGSAAPLHVLAADVRGQSRPESRSRALRDFDLRQVNTCLTSCEFSS